MRQPAGSLHADLLPLVGRARTSLVLGGGFALPGRLRKWSSLAPPEVRAVASGASSVAVQVDRGSRVGDQVLRVDADGDVVLVPLEEHGLQDGEYLVSLFVDGADRPEATTQLRLRSADSPLFNVTEVDLQLVYTPANDPLWILSAGSPSPAPYVNGPRMSDGLPQEHADDPMPAPAARPRRPTAAAPARLRVGVATTADSCMSTGFHRIHASDGPPRAAHLPDDRGRVHHLRACQALPHPWPQPRIRGCRPWPAAQLARAACRAGHR